MISLVLSTTRIQDYQNQREIDHNEIICYAKLSD